MALKGQRCIWIFGYDLHQQKSGSGHKKYLCHASVGVVKARNFDIRDLIKCCMLYNSIGYNKLAQYCLWLRLLQIGGHALQNVIPKSYVKQLAIKVVMCKMCVFGILVHPAFQKVSSCRFANYIFYFHDTFKMTKYLRRRPFIT